ncbi:hypothetical protein [Helicobacter sp. 16-1353]|uniref:hypothetical protein n=1 Tax=Helicobacter sp. 16-1353 TaxID=2004996 RepID=UPI0015EFAD51|nr:hypothetical protein [Helicobacter sp. 16-1353]
MAKELVSNIVVKKHAKDKKCTDEFQKLRNLALELKNMQLQVIKDLNKKELIKEI